MSRLTREEIQRDEVREAVVSASTWFADHVWQILIGVAAVIAVVIGVVLFLNYQDRREAEASFQLSEALKVYRAPIDAPETDAIDDLFGTPPDSAPGEDDAGAPQTPVAEDNGEDEGPEFRLRGGKAGGGASGARSGPGELRFHGLGSAGFGLPGPDCCRRGRYRDGA